MTRVCEMYFLLLLFFVYSLMNLSIGSSGVIYFIKCRSILKGNLISTPATTGTILPGVTRRSIVEIARDHGYKVILLQTT